MSPRPTGRPHKSAARRLVTASGNRSGPPSRAWPDGELSSAQRAAGAPSHDPTAGARRALPKLERIGGRSTMTAFVPFGALAAFGKSQVVGEVKWRWQDAASAPKGTNAV